MHPPLHAVVVAAMTARHRRQASTSRLRHWMSQLVREGVQRNSNTTDLASIECSTDERTFGGCDRIPKDLLAGIEDLLRGRPPTGDRVARGPHRPQYVGWPHVARDLLESA